MLESASVSNTKKQSRLQTRPICPRCASTLRFTANKESFEIAVCFCEHCKAWWDLKELRKDETKFQEWKEDIARAQRELQHKQPPLPHDKWNSCFRHVEPTDYFPK